MFAIIDLETTGLDPQKDRIFEIAILLYDGNELSETFCTLVNPEFQLMPGIERLTGVIDRQLLDAPRFFEIARRIVELTKNRILVAHHARFDYAFLRREFSRLGYRYQRKQLCTERLSREWLPGLPSYRLQYLCKKLDIPLEGHHRALADARATLQLFKTLRVLSVHSGTTEDIGQITRENNLPLGLNRTTIDNLPDSTGVYFFYNEREELIYIGKSKSIRKRVLSHFSADITSTRAHTMKQQIHQVRYEVTGSELVALLLESDLIKTHQPRFNRDQRTTRYRYGLFATPANSGHLAFSIQVLNAHTENSPPGELVISFSNKKGAVAFLERILVKYELCQKLCGLCKRRGPCFNYHLRQCRGACINEELAEPYNLRVQQAIDQYYYEQPDFLIVTEGRRSGEQAVILIENAIYKGFGYINQAALDNRSRASMHKRIVQRKDNQDIRRIINRYLREHPEIEMLPLSQPPS